jgi:hypothetical protein
LNSIPEAAGWSVGILTRDVISPQWDAVLRSQATPLSPNKAASSAAAATAPIQKQAPSSNAATSAGGGVNSVPEATRAVDATPTDGQLEEKSSTLGSKSASGAGGGAGVSRLEIKVPVGGAGLIVGKQGKTIKSIKARSGCKVELAAEVNDTLFAGFHSPQCLTCDRLCPLSYLPPPPPFLSLTSSLFFFFRLQPLADDATRKLVTIEGAPDKVKLARTLLLDVLSEWLRPQDGEAGSKENAPQVSCQQPLPPHEKNVCSCSCSYAQGFCASGYTMKLCFSVYIHVFVFLVLRICLALTFFLNRFF